MSSSPEPRRREAWPAMFVPVPFATNRSDDDCASMIWKRDRKVLTVNLNCYGGAVVWCGLLGKPSSCRVILTFEEAWKWFCDPVEAMPAPTPPPPP